MNGELGKMWVFILSLHGLQINSNSSPSGTYEMLVPVPPLLLCVPITSHFLPPPAHHSCALSSLPRPLKAVAARLRSGASPLLCGSDKDLFVASQPVPGLQSVERFPGRRTGPRILGSPSGL